MKHIILETLFGWLTRPILLWTGTDILTILAEIFVIATAISIVRNIKIRIEEKRNKTLKTHKAYRDIDFRLIK